MAATICYQCQGWARWPGSLGLPRCGSRWRPSPQQTKALGLPWANHKPASPSSQGPGTGECQAAAHPQITLDSQRPPQAGSEEVRLGGSQRMVQSHTVMTKVPTDRLNSCPVSFHRPSLKPLPTHHSLKKIPSFPLQVLCLCHSHCPECSSLQRHLSWDPTLPVVNSEDPWPPQLRPL